MTFQELQPKVIAITSNDTITRDEKLFGHLPTFERID